ncbi:MAG: TetR/AcrR family transcriptional regulator, partial [Sediminibacterium sp.]|nr:TetR/AcrR family transcriptional regulator [Sediminibacterium sp.]
MILEVFTARQIEIMEASSKRIHQFGIQELTIKNLAADLNLSEAALYRHFNSKNDILSGVLSYFIQEMNAQVALIINDTTLTPSIALKKIFDYLFNSFVKNPALVSVIFSEGIFQYNPDLTEKIKAMLGL